MLAMKVERNYGEGTEKRRTGRERMAVEGCKLAKGGSMDGRMV